MILAQAYGGKYWTRPGSSTEDLGAVSSQYRRTLVCFHYNVVFVKNVGRGLVRRTKSVQYFLKVEFLGGAN